MSTFTLDASDHVATIEPKVVLIEGNRLAQLMIDFKHGKNVCDQANRLGLPLGRPIPLWVPLVHLIGKRTMDDTSKQELHLDGFMQEAKKTLSETDIPDRLKKQREDGIEQESLIIDAYESTSAPKHTEE